MADGRGGGNEEQNSSPSSASASPLSLSSPSSSSSSSATTTATTKSRAFTLLVAGLDGDWTRSAFGDVLKLVPHADSATRLAARCAFCAADAHFSVRLSSTSSSSSSSHSSSQPGTARVPAPTLEGSSSSSSSSSPPLPQVHVGGADSYAPACRRHYLQHSGSSSSNGMNSTSKVLVERQK